MNAHRHRFRNSFAVDLLSRGAPPYDVAKLLGTPWRRQKGVTLHSFGTLRERVRRIMESPRRTGDNRHTAGTAKDRAEADTVKPKEIVADGPVSRIPWAVLQTRKLFGFNRPSVSIVSALSG